MWMYQIYKYKNGTTYTKTKLTKNITLLNNSHQVAKFPAKAG